MKLEVAVAPVSDVARVKDFHKALGWREDADFAAGAEFRVVFHDVGEVFHHIGTEGRVPGPAPAHKSYGSFASFSDPDGNGLLLQEITTRLPGR